MQWRIMTLHVWYVHVDRRMLEQQADILHAIWRRASDMEGSSTLGILLIDANARPAMSVVPVSMFRRRAPSDGSLRVPEAHRMIVFVNAVLGSMSRCQSRMCRA